MPNHLPKRSVLALAVALITFPAACDSGSTEPEPEPEEEMSATARVYLTTALNIMQTYSIKKYEVGWPPLRAEALEMAIGAVTKADTYDAIRYALTALGDNHSPFIFHLTRKRQPKPFFPLDRPRPWPSSKT
jgi:hypothetical protein